MIGIYKITSLSGKIYIGQSIDIERRKLDHSSCKERSKLYSSIQKHGFKNHQFEVQEECTIEELNNRERFWQDFYDVTGTNGLNLVLQDSSELPKAYSEEVRENMRLGQLGQVQKKETVQKRVDKNTGKKRSKEFGQCMSTLNKNRVHSEESRENFRQGQLRMHKNGYISPRGKKVINTETGEIFNSMTSLSKHLGITYDILKKSLDGLVRTNNYTNFKYYKDE